MNVSLPDYKQAHRQDEAGKKGKKAVSYHDHVDNAVTLEFERRNEEY